jgi:hypothetical protein
MVWVLGVCVAVAGCRLFVYGVYYVEHVVFVWRVYVLCVVLCYLVCCLVCALVRACLVCGGAGVA